jgi:hypothetical protein
MGVGLKRLGKHPIAKSSQQNAIKPFNLFTRTIDLFIVCVYVFSLSLSCVGFLKEGSLHFDFA